jgi:hypothetical protein
MAHREDPRGPRDAKAVGLEEATTKQTDYEARKEQYGANDDM